jgi:EmrB/QacA subfamily drug resistance transporter
MIDEADPASTDPLTSIAGADGAPGTVEDAVPVADPRRWITLGILLTSVMIVGLDSSVLNVAIPTILREFDTTLTSLQWVITGYSLTFAACLIIGGRLSDIFGARRIFLIGVTLFGIGSLIASMSGNVVHLVIGEAIIEGLGASLMLPATMGIMARTFLGHERATAFAAWGAVLGAAVSFGPLLGGFLTTNYSWRWAFRLNVIVAPIAILGVFAFVRRLPPVAQRQRLDIPGALLIVPGMVLLVFGISEGATYGWLHPIEPFEIGGWTLWPTSMPIAVTPIAFALSALILVAFYRLQRRKEREDRDPLFEFSNLRRRGFRFGMLSLMLLAMGQVAFLLVLSVVLQDGLQLSAVETGLWLVPSGLAIVVGSQIGNRLTRRIGTTNVVRMGLIIQTTGFIVLTVLMTSSLTFLKILPGLILFGCGVGFSSSQLNNVILADVPAERAGSSSGANTTVRMIGSALGIATVSALLSSTTLRSVIDALNSSSLPAAVQADAVAHVRSAGITGPPPPGLSVADTATIRSAIERAIFSGARWPLALASGIVALAVVSAFLIPHIPIGPPSPDEDDEFELAVMRSELMAESTEVQ